LAKRSRKFPHAQAIFAYRLIGGLPAVAVSLAWVWGGDHSPETRGTVTLFVLGSWLGFAAAARSRVARPPQTMAKLLLALRWGVFSVPARGVRRGDPLRN